MNNVTNEGNPMTQDIRGLEVTAPVTDAEASRASNLLAETGNFTYSMKRVLDDFVQQRSMHVCKGRNCTSTDGTNHSPECYEDYNTTVMAGARAEDNPHDPRTAANACTQWENDRQRAMLQAAGEHPAPYAKHCEARAFEIRRLAAELARPETTVVSILRAERDTLQAKLNQQQDMVEKCMVAMNRNADLGQADEKERDALKADAARFQKAIELEDNTESLLAAVMNNAPDANAIRDEFDAAMEVQP